MNWNNYLPVQQGMDQIALGLKNQGDIDLSNIVTQTHAFFGINTVSEYYAECLDVLREVKRYKRIPKEILNQVDYWTHFLERAFRIANAG